MRNSDKLVISGGPVGNVMARASSVWYSPKNVNAFRFHEFYGLRYLVETGKYNQWSGQK